MFEKMQVAPKVQETDPFESLVRLDHEAVLFIPSTFDVNKVDLELQDKVVLHVAGVLAQRFGGVTVESPAKGGWHSEWQGMVWEKVVPVKVYLPDLSRITKQVLVDMAGYVKHTMSQESVLLVVDGKGMLA